mgnify:CR=1 FL=1
MVQFASEAVVQTRAAKLIVLDRDGVINHDSDQFIKSPEEWRAVPGSLGAIGRVIVRSLMIRRRATETPL